MSGLKASLPGSQALVGQQGHTHNSHTAMSCNDHFWCRTHAHGIAANGADVADFSGCFVGGAKHGAVHAFSKHIAHAYFSGAAPHNVTKARMVHGAKGWEAGTEAGVIGTNL